MRCDECGGTYVEKSGRLQLADTYVGLVTVDLGEYFRCDSCDDYLFSLEASKQIHEARDRALNQKLQSQPLCAFATAGETATLLGISRQAQHKHRRIRRGFIFQVEFGGKKVYLRESIRLFKDKGDGRFPLCGLTEPSEYDAIMDTACMPDLGERFQGEEVFYNPSDLDYSETRTPSSRSDNVVRMTSWRRDDGDAARELLSEAS